MSRGQSTQERTAAITGRPDSDRMEYAPKNTMASSCAVVEDLVGLRAEQKS